jgi:hypothetical protein
MNTKSVALTLALGALLPAAAGCETEDVRGNVMVSSPLGGTTPASGLGSWLYIYLAKDDCPNGKNDCDWYRLRIDGQMVVYEQAFDFVRIYAVNQAGLIIPSGTHVIELIDERTGNVLVKTTPLDMRPDMLHHLAVFGPPGALVQRWFIDVPGQVPGGHRHTRVLNALASGEPIQPVQCADPDRVNCAAVGAPIEHGGMFEADITDADLQMFVWRLAAPGISNAPLNGVLFRTSGAIGDPGYVFHMPVSVDSTTGGLTSSF